VREGEREGKPEDGDAVGVEEGVFEMALVEDVALGGLDDEDYTEW
jgi:hypothetical protein